MERPLTQNITPGHEPLDLKEYERAGGYQALRKALAMDPAAIQAEVKQSNLRGRGGAGFPTGSKWSFVPMGPIAPRPKYLLVNADEMEPGTFKDRYLLEGDPHQMIEAVLVAARALDADRAFIFLRASYHLAERRLTQALAEARQAGYAGANILGSGYGCEVGLHTSAGRYMCGEETGLINALEGKRAQPRAKPPYPQSVGLWGRPTVVNNVETICCVRHIVNRGAEWFRSLSRSGDGGTKLYGVSGRVNSPGLWELPMGTTLGEVLDRAGGMRPGLKFRAVQPGGASTGFMLPQHRDVPMDYAQSQQLGGARLGTGTMIVLDDQTCPVSMLLSLERFFDRESCGWCTPCREGLPWVEQCLESLEAGSGSMQDIEMLDMHVSQIRMGHTFCALAPGAMEPLESALKYFRDDFVRHAREGKCPWKK